MKLTYSCAIVSFCPDLTARDAPSLPVGVLLVGEISKHRLASVLVPSVRVPRLDDITREVLMSVPDLLRLHVDEVLTEDITLPAAEVLRRLHEKLRNTLFVSEISDDKVVELDEPAAIAQLLIDEYDAAVERDGRELEYVALDELSQVGASLAATSPPRANKRIGVGSIPDVSSTFRFTPSERLTHAERA